MEASISSAKETNDSPPRRAAAAWRRVPREKILHLTRLCPTTRVCGRRWCRPAEGCGVDASTTPTRSSRNCQRVQIRRVQVARVRVQTGRIQSSNVLHLHPSRKKGQFRETLSCRGGNFCSKGRSFL